MKALTIWQPWASLIAWGEKTYETRSWETSYRGLLAIHASRYNDDSAEQLTSNLFVREAFMRAGMSQDLTLPAGVVLCVVDLVDVVPIRKVLRRITSEEQNFGDYSTGRFAWKLEHLRILEEPIQARGHQGLWEWPRELASLQLKKVTA